MIEFIKKLFVKDTTPGIEQMLANGAVIIDVRSPGEYKSGHLSQSINIPLDDLAGRLSELDTRKPVITCCASGMRSASAKKILRAKGFEQVRNGGGWASLKRFTH